MSRFATHTRRPPLTVLLALGLAVGACGDAPSPVSTSEPEALSLHGHSASEAASVHGDLAALRQVTAKFHRFENAASAEYVQVTDCKEHPTEGGMGYHYGNFEYYLDGEANLLEPEVLVYEPGPNGKLHLVAVEYLVPFFAWAGDPDVDDPPQLFGQDMKRDDAQGEWLLHVWIWKHNPSGMFADWNPEVSCEHAP